MMTSKISKLPENVVSQLRSGQGITSTAQCMEELVLNSIDSNSLNIAVRLDLDIHRITVVDDGEGITMDGLNSTGLRYFTSKCCSLMDLESNLKYFGFRGEALANIISISAIVEITSRAQHKEETYFQRYLYGKSKRVSVNCPARPSVGTTVSITDFMYNLPVRRKLIKSEFDIESCRERLESIAMVHPHISFSLATDRSNRIIMKTKRSSSCVQICKQLYGLKIEEYLRPLNCTAKPFNISGFISTRPCHFNSVQLIFVNKRRVYNKKLINVVNNLLYKSSILQRRSSSTLKTSVAEVSPNQVARQHCLYLININCPINEYDISFEPRKLKVQFCHMDILLNTIELALITFMKQENITIGQEIKFKKTVSHEIIEPELGGEAKKNMLSNFTLKFSIHSKDVGSVEGLPARRKCTLDRHQNTSELSPEGVGIPNTGGLECDQMPIKYTSSLHTLRELVTKQSDDKKDSPFSDHSNVTSSLGTFKRMYFSSKSANPSKQQAEHPTQMQSQLDGIKMVKKYPSNLGLKKLSRISKECLRADNMSHQFRKGSEEANLSPDNANPRYYDNIASLEKSFHFNPQQSFPIMSKDLTFNNSYGLSDSNTPTSMGNNVFSYSNHFCEVENTTREEKDDVFTLDTQPLLCIDSRESSSNNNKASDISSDYTDISQGYRSVVDYNGRQVYIDKESGNSSYKQPKKQKDPIWRKNLFMGGEILAIPFAGCYESNYNKTFALSHGYISNKSKRKKVYDKVGNEKFLKIGTQSCINARANVEAISENDVENDSQSFTKWNDDELLLMRELLNNDSKHGAKYAYRGDGHNQSSECPLHNSPIASYKISHPYKLEKDILQHVKVIGQLDKKFIAITVPYAECNEGQPSTDHKLLVLLDQHAVDERIQLEKTLDDNYEWNNGTELLRSSIIDQPFQLKFRPMEIGFLTTYKQIFESFGLHYTQIEATLIEFSAIPSILVAKDHSEKHTRRCQLSSQTVEAMVEAICNTISTLRGSAEYFKERRPLPQPLAYIFNTFACKAAIKFGDRLNRDECQSLLGLLSKCRLPFQCAHGRPSIYPLLEFSHLSKNTRNKVTRLNFEKLRNLGK